MKPPRLTKSTKAEYPHLLIRYDSGKRVRQYFEHKSSANIALAEARRAASEMGNEPALTPVELDGVRLARRLKVNLVAAVMDYAERSQAREVACGLGALIEAKLEALVRSGASSAHLGSCRLLYARFLGAVGERSAADVTQGECADFLFSQGWGAVSVRYYRALLLGLFAFAVDAGWLRLNPVRGIKAPSSPVSPVTVLAPDQCAALLAACSVDILPGVAIMLFAGLRPESEVHRLDWEQVNFERGFIEVLASKSKSARRRLVMILPVLAAWLEPFKGSVGPVWPAEITGRRRFREAKTAAGLVPWPADVLRHSFASYHLAEWKDAGATALQLGHSTTKMLFEHYREVVTPQAAASFWGLTPATART